MVGLRLSLPLSPLSALSLPLSPPPSRFLTGTHTCGFDSNDRWKKKWTTIKFPNKGSVFDYYINAKTGAFAPWADLVSDVAYDSKLTPMTSVFVPTAETSSFTYFLDMMLELRAPIMFVGPAGTGKTQLVKGKLASLPEGNMSLNINFNYFTDVISFQKILESQLEKKAGVNYGPPGTTSSSTLLMISTCQSWTLTTPRCPSPTFANISAGDTGSIARSSLRR